MFHDTCDSPQHVLVSTIIEDVITGDPIIGGRDDLSNELFARPSEKGLSLVYSQDPRRSDQPVAKLAAMDLRTHGMVGCALAHPRKIPGFG